MAANEQQLIQLAPGALELFEQVSLRYDAEIAPGIPPEALLVPGFWAHHAVKLRPMHEIRARAADGTWVGYYLVLDCSRTWAKVQCLSMHRLTTGDVALTQASEAEVKAFIDQHKVTHRGPHKYSVVRKADNAVLTEGIQVKEDAIAWLERHARAQIGAPAIAKSEPVTAT
jgi:hypothetical protein